MNKKNIVEIIEMAIDMEMTGLKLYSSLAKIAHDDSLITFFEYAAREEEDHLSFYKNFLKKCAYKDKVDITNFNDLIVDSSEKYQKKVNDLNKMIFKDQTMIKFKTLESTTQVLDILIELEEHSISFFSELIPFSFTEDHHIIIQIINEEKEHLKKLLEIKCKFEREEFRSNNKF